MIIFDYVHQWEFKLKDKGKWNKTLWNEKKKLKFVDALQKKLYIQIKNEEIVQFDIYPRCLYNIFYTNCSQKTICIFAESMNTPDRSNKNRWNVEDKEN